ncbi:MAG: oligosaccharide flippase family protein [Candidatus Promineifilaceae bacterium]
MSLARRGAFSVLWNGAGGTIEVLSSLARGILLARLIGVELIGTYAFALAVMAISAVVLRLGMGEAFLHRTEETEDEDELAAVHFTLSLGPIILWLVAVLAVCFVWVESTTLRTALVVLAFTTAMVSLTETPLLILARRVQHRRLAIIRLISGPLSAFVSVLLALLGAGLSALLAIDLVRMIVSVVVLYIWRPFWRPRLSLAPHVVRYFMRFSVRSFSSGILLQLLNEIDDVWTGVVLGKTQLGFYSRAFTFAGYPRTILAGPVELVSAGMYSELKWQRGRLSEVYFQTNALLLRAGILPAGMLFLAAPALIPLLIGERWLPMLPAFRLMLLFSILEPIKLTAAGLFAAVGRPGITAVTRAAQLAALAIGLPVLGTRFGIAGVALAINVMAATGIMGLFWQSRRYVDISYTRLAVSPLLAMALALGLAVGSSRLIGLTGQWASLLAASLFAVGYVSMLLLLDYHQLRAMVAGVHRALLRAPAPVQPDLA